MGVGVGPTVGTRVGVGITVVVGVGSGVWVGRGVDVAVGIWVGVELACAQPAASTALKINAPSHRNAISMTTSLAVLCALTPSLP